MKRRKPDMLDRKLKALARLGRTKGGRAIIRDCSDGILACLCDAVGKP